MYMAIVFNVHGLIAMRTALYKQAAWFVNRGGDVEGLEGELGV